MRDPRGVGGAYVIGAAVVWAAIIVAAAVVLDATDFQKLWLLLVGGAISFVILVPGGYLLPKRSRR